MQQLARDNTYNSDQDLSSQINFTVYGPEGCDWCWADDIYVALCVHRGGDVRGNYGRCRIYRVDSLADTGFFDWTLGWHVEAAPLSGVDQDDLDQKHLAGLPWAVDERLSERCSPGYASMPSSELYSETTNSDSCYWLDGSAYLTDGETVWKATPYHYHAELDLPKDGSGWLFDASIDTESLLKEALGEELEVPEEVAEAWDGTEVVENWIQQHEVE